MSATADPPPPSGARYRATRRRLLVDMHVPGWEPAFLSRFEPAILVDAATGCGAEALMVYFQSHLGLCYYPTRVGAIHPAALARDLAGEVVALAREAGLATCAYYSVHFNNQAWEDHPDWRLQPAAPASIGILPRERYGIVCLNHPDYRAFALAHIAEILAYPVDALFCDMVWWNGVCRCGACRSRYRAETGDAIPEVVDWRAPAWLQFQTRRTAWLAEWAEDMAQLAHRLRPEIAYYHNFALGLANWTRGTSMAAVSGNDFLGGDFYGPAEEQLMMTRFMRGASKHAPAEYMTTVGAHLISHTDYRSPAQMRRRALAAAHADCAFLAILALDPIGTIAPAALTRCRQGFAATSPYAGHSLGTPEAQVAVYLPDDCRADPGAAPLPLDQAPASSAPDYPAYRCAAGAVRALQRAQLDFAVIGPHALDRLDAFPAIMLADGEGLGEAEQRALMAYVERGGILYGARACGRQRDGHWPLAQWLGIVPRFAESGAAPVHYRRHGDDPPIELRPPVGTLESVIRFAPPPRAQVLAQLTLPYGYPAFGSAAARDFASIHSSPPWEDLDEALAICVTRRKGQVIWSAASLEIFGDAAAALPVAWLAERLDPPELALTAHPDVWCSRYRLGDVRQILLLNQIPADPPVACGDARLDWDGVQSWEWRVVECDGETPPATAGGGWQPAPRDGCTLPPFTCSLFVELRPAHA